MKTLEQKIIEKLKEQNTVQKELTEQYKMFHDAQVSPAVKIIYDVWMNANEGIEESILSLEMELSALEKQLDTTKALTWEKIEEIEVLRDKLSMMCFCKPPSLCKRCKEEQTICNNEEIRKDIFRYLTEINKLYENELGR